MSNCHKPEETVTTRKQKGGSRQEIACSIPITFYNKYVGGVDHADQMIGLYDLERTAENGGEKYFFACY